MSIDNTFLRRTVGNDLSRSEKTVGAIIDREHDVTAWRQKRVKAPKAIHLTVAEESACFEDCPKTPVIAFKDMVALSVGEIRKRQKLGLKKGDVSETLEGCGVM